MGQLVGNDVCNLSLSPRVGVLGITQQCRGAKRDKPPVLHRPVRELIDEEQIALRQWVPDAQFLGQQLEASDGVIERKRALCLESSCRVHSDRQVPGFIATLHESFNVVEIAYGPCQELSSVSSAIVPSNLGYVWEDGKTHIGAHLGRFVKDGPSQSVAARFLAASRGHVAQHDEVRLGFHFEGE